MNSRLLVGKFWFSIFPKSMYIFFLTKVLLSGIPIQTSLAMCSVFKMTIYILRFILIEKVRSSRFKTIQLKQNIRLLANSVCWNLFYLITGMISGSAFITYKFKYANIMKFIAFFILSWTVLCEEKICVGFTCVFKLDLNIWIPASE